MERAPRGALALFMTDTSFFPQARTLTFGQVAEMAQAALPDGVDGEHFAQRRRSA